MPACLEIKLKLDGSRQQFACDLVALEPGRGILRYVVDRELDLAGVRLSPGCLSYAVYWTDRPYNVYWFVAPEGGSLAFYFNVADSVELARDVFKWRDLSVDVLVRPDCSAEVLDEAELPPDLPKALRARITVARDAILADRAPLTREVRSIVERSLAPT